VGSHTDIILSLAEAPELFPGSPSAVEVIQTHISIIFLTKARAYKFKKELKFDFLDYSTIEKRYEYLKKELSLNQRLTRGIYLEILPVFIESGRLNFIQGQLYDYVLVMNRLPASGVLSELLKKQKSTSDLAGLLALTLAHFYRSEDSKIAQGHSSILQDNLGVIKANLAELRGSTVVDSNPLWYRLVTLFSERFLNKNRELLLSRGNPGSIRDGHGDLRIEHIYKTGDSISIYDCVEFNETFRKGDYLNDVAFLVMELDLFGYSGFSTTFYRQFMVELKNLGVEGASDPGLDQLLNFYKTYRALVRIKVNSLLLAESEIGEKQKSSASELLTSLLGLSLRYIFSSAGEPVVFIIMGKTGSGKSTLAGKLAELLKCPAFSSDRIRKEMFGLDPFNKTPDHLKGEVYSRATTRKVYKRLAEEAVLFNQKREHVVIDATFSDPEIRASFSSQLFEKGIRYKFVEIKSSDEVVCDRMKQREQEHTVSDATLSDKKMIDSFYVSPSEIPKEDYLAIENSASADQVLALLAEKIIKNLIDTV